MYLGILSRFPSAEEVNIAETYFQSGNVNRRQAAVDLAWALINSASFFTGIEQKLHRGPGPMKMKGKVKI